MKNKILINLALWLLSLVDINTIKYKNSWKHYCDKIQEFIK